MVLNAFTPSRQVIKEWNKGIYYRYKDQFCAATEKQTDRLGQTYLHADQFYTFGGHILIYICSHGESFRCFLLEWIGGSEKNRVFLFFLFFVFLFFCSWEGTTSAVCWSDKEFSSESDLLTIDRKPPLRLWRSVGRRWALCDFHTSLAIPVRQIKLQLSGNRNTPGLLKEFLIASTDHMIWHPTI